METKNADFVFQQQDDPIVDEKDSRRVLIEKLVKIVSYTTIGNYMPFDTERHLSDPNAGSMNRGEDSVLRPFKSDVKMKTFKSWNPLSDAIVIFDEWHNLLKVEIDSSRTRCRVYVWHCTTRRAVICGLTATPIVDGSEDLINEINILRGNPSLSRDVNLDGPYERVAFKVSNFSSPSNPKDAGQLIPTVVSRRSQAFETRDLREVAGYYSAYSLSSIRIAYPSSRRRPSPICTTYLSYTLSRCRLRCSKITEQERGRGYRRGHGEGEELKNGKFYAGRRRTSIAAVG